MEKLANSGRLKRPPLGRLRVRVPLPLVYIFWDKVRIKQLLILILTYLLTITKERKFLWIQTIKKKLCLQGGHR